MLLESSSDSAKAPFEFADFTFPVIADALEGGVEGEKLVGRLDFWDESEGWSEIVSRRV